MKILVCDHYTPEALSRLQGVGEVQRSHGFSPTQEELEKTEALMIRSRTKVNLDLLERAPKLKYIVTSTSGFDHIDFLCCERSQVKVAYTPDANAEAASIHTFALILNLTQSVHLADRKIRQQEWKDSLTKSESLNGLQLGLIGFGRIGQRVARMGRFFGMNVVAHDPYQETTVLKEQKVEPLSLIEVLLSSDVISLHTPLTPETRHLINHQTLEHINPEAYLVNVARGELIDETELAVFMEAGGLKGAALDVFEKEPLPQDSRLRSLKNVILTPHLGAYNTQAFERASQLAVDELLYMLEEQKSPCQLPLKTGWFEVWLKGLSSGTKP